MAQISVSDFLNGSPTVDGFGNPTGLVSKQLAVEQASEEKKKFLQNIRDANEKARVDYEKTLAGRVGLTQGGIAADATNVGASVFSGTTRLAGNALALPNSLIAAYQDGQLDDADIASLNNYRQGKATPEDIARINSPKQYRDIRGQLQNSDVTPLQLAESANWNREWARNINDAADYSGLVDQTNRNNLNASLADGFDSNWAQTKEGFNQLTQGNLGGAVDMFSGAAKLGGNVIAAGVQNPLAVGELAAENAPQLLIGGLGGVAGKAALGAFNTGYAADIYQKGIEAYQRDNGGALPDEAKRHEIAAWAASAGGAEMVGDLVGIGATKLFGKAADAGADVARTSLTKAALGTAKGTAGAGATEALTEGFQTFAENQAEGKATSALEIYQAGAMGGLAGGALSGSGRAAHEVGKLASQRTEDAEKALKTAGKDTIDPELQKEIDASVKAGDTSKFSDPKNKDTYRPVETVEALVKHAQNKDTSEEDKAKAVEKAQEIISNLETMRDSTNSEVDTSKKEQELAELNQLFDLEDDPEIKSVYSEEIGLLDEEILNLKTKTSTVGEQKAIQKQVDGFNNQITKARNALNTLNVQSNKSIDSDIELATIDKNESPEAVKASASKVLNLSMAIPERLSPEVATKLSNNQNLTSEQRNYFKNFAEARLAEKKAQDMGKVGMDILNGNTKTGDIGLNQYRTNIATAVNNKNQDGANQAFNSLKKFASSQIAKAEALTKAYETFQSTGNTVQIKKLGNVWTTLKEAIPSMELKSQGGYTVNANTARFVDQVNTEAGVMAAVLKEAEAAMAVAFQTAQTKPQQAKTAAPSTPQTKAKTQPTTDTNEVSRESKAQSKPKVDEKTQPTTTQEATVTATAPTSQPQATVPSATPTPRQDTKKATEVVANDVTVAPVAAQDLQSTTDNSESTVEDTQQSTEGVQEFTVDKESTEDSTTEEPQSDPQKEPEASTYSGLPALQRTVDPDVATPYTNIKDRAARYLKQSKNAGEDAPHKGKRPLVAVQGFLKQWVEGKLKFSEFLDEQPIGKQRDALLNFRNTAAGWINRQLNKSIVQKKGGLNKKGNEIQVWRDAVQDLINPETGKIDANVKTAIAYGAYSWVIDNLSNPKNDAEASLALFGLDEETGVINRAGQKALRDVISTEDMMINEMGNTIISALGLKANPNAPKDYLPKLAAGLGAHAFVTLVNEGLINTVEPNRTTVETWVTGLPKLPSTVDKDRMNFHFVSINKEHAQVKQMKEANKGSGMVLDKLFKADKIPTMASEKPLKFSQKLAKKTQQAISKAQAAVLNAAQQVPHTVIPEMWKANKVLGADAMLKIAGWKDVNSFTYHVNSLEGIEAQNDNLEKQLEAMEDLVSEDITKPHYPVYEVWKNFRVGVATRNMNLQSSKIHRFMFSRPEWTSTIELNNAEHQRALNIAFAQAFGLKIDKEAFDKVITKWETLLNEVNEKTGYSIKDVATALHEHIESDLAVPKELADAVVAISTGAENMQTFQALVALGKFLNAQETGAKTVDITMLVGIDGKTNGPILSHFALGAMDSLEDMKKLMQKGGFYTVDDAKQNYNTWYADNATNEDLYESLASAISAQIPTADRQQIEAILDALTKDGKATKAGRNLAKTPLTSFAFGSSVSKSLENMTNAFLETVVEQVQDAYNGKPKAKPYSQVIEQLNSLLGAHVHYTEKQFMELDLEKGEGLKLANGIRKAFEERMGKPVQSTMETYFSSYIERRNAVTANAQVAFGIFQAVFNDARDKKIKELIESGQMAVDKTGKPVHDLSNEQELEVLDSISKFLPRVNNMYSLSEGDADIDAIYAGAEGTETDSKDKGIFLAKTDSGLSNEAMHKNEVALGTPLNRSTGAVKSVSPQILLKAFKTPGVAGLPYMMHALDSWIMHRALKGSESLNVHDEIGNSVLNANETGQKINHATWIAMTRYSPMREAYILMENALIQVADAAGKGEISQEALVEIHAASKSIYQTTLDKKALKDVPHLLGNSAFLQEGAEQLFKADEMRLNYARNVTSIDQYTWEGGEYRVTEQDRAEAEARYQAHMTKGAEVSESLKAATETLGGIKAQDLPQRGFVGISQDTLQEQEAVIEDAVVPVKEDPKESTKYPASTYIDGLGEVGQPVIPSLPALVKWFETKPVRTAAEVIKAMNHLNSADRSLIPGVKNLKRRREFYSELSKQLEKIIDPNLEVRMITPETNPNDLIGQLKDNARGAFITNEQGKQVIYLRGPQFVASGLTTETVMHELVHAAIAMTIKTSTDPDVVARVEDLKRLMGDAKKLVESKTELAKYAPAVADVQEFVAWGMTSYGFQKDVLNAFSTKVDTSRKNSPLWKAAQKFVSLLKDIFYRGSSKSTQAITTSALTQVIADVTMLMHAVEQNQQANGVGLNLSQENTEIDNYNSQQLLNKLDGNVGEDFEYHLSNVVSSITTKFGDRVKELRADEARTPLDAWLKSLNVGDQPTAMEALGHFDITNKEAFVIEEVQTIVEEALNNKELMSSNAYGELEKLYKEAKTKLSPSDFGSLDDYNFVFHPGMNADGTSNHLARFAALGLGSKKINDLLQFDSTNKKEDKPKTFALRVQEFFEKLLTMFSNKTTGTYEGQQANEKLETLITKLVDIEAKNRTRLKREQNKFEKATDYAEDKTAQGMEALRVASLKVLNSDFLKKSKVEIVRGAAAAGRVIAADQADKLLEVFQKMGNHYRNNRESMLAGILNDVVGSPEWAQKLLRMAKTNENNRMDIIEAMSRNVKSLFKDNGNYMNDAQKSAVTAVLLRTGAHNLLGTLSLPNLDEFMGNAEVRKQAIDNATKQLQGDAQTVNVQKHLADVLGYYLATGKTAGWLMMNAHQIANLNGTEFADQVDPATVAHNEEVLKKLISIIAIDYTPTDLRMEVQEVIRTEMQRTDGNDGIESLMKVHQMKEQEALEKLFANNPTLMIHGYVPDILNQRMDLKVANAYEGDWLEAQGYVKKGQVAKDPHDPDTSSKYVYVLQDGGLNPYVSGAMSLSTLGTRGQNSMLHNGHDAKAQAKMNTMKKSLLKPAAMGSLGKSTHQYMAPVYDEQGNVVNWRYLMQEQTKQLLERDDRFDKVMGSLAGSVFDKQTSSEQNDTVLEALKAKYDEDPQAAMSNQYAMISPKSSSEDFREIWRLLPDQTKRLAKDIFGEDAIYVDKSLVNIIFGDRKLSAADMFDDVNEMRKLLRDEGAPDYFTKALASVPLPKRFAIIAVEAMVKTFGRLRHGMTATEAERYALTTAVKVARAEDMWQELVKEIKDIIVVKSMVVLVGNIWSNFTLLKLNGVPISKMVRDHYVAMKGATRFQNDSAELSQLQMLKDAGISAFTPEMQHRMDELQDALNRNPVKVLIDAGLMPTIVEDIANTVDNFSYKSRLQRKTKNMTDKLPSAVREVGKQVYMTHDTAWYKSLYRMTQLSDFVARYSMYEHLINDKKNPLSKSDAIQKASESFINYDIPMQRGLQYMDDMGVMVFVKYFFRIQKVLFKLLQEKPFNVLAMIGLHQLMDLGPTVMESSAIPRIGNNPFTTGAFRFLPTLGELPAVDMLGKLLK